MLMSSELIKDNTMEENRKVKGREATKQLHAPYLSRYENTGKRKAAINVLVP